MGDYLLIPDGGKVPDGIPEDITIIRKPCDKTYLVSTSVADLIRQINALDMIKLCGLDADGWHIDEVRQKISGNEIAYAGKYRMPDYELILAKECNHLEPFGDFFL